jgi:hypothetical protein
MKNKYDVTEDGVLKYEYYEDEVRISLVWR